MRQAGFDNELHSAKPEVINGRSSLRRIIVLVKPLIPMLSFIFLITMVMTGIAIVIPKMAGIIVDNSLADVNINQLDKISLGLFGLIFLMALLRYVSTYLLGRVGAQFLRKLRQKVFEHMIYLSMNFFHKRQTGELNARIMTNLEIMQNLITNHTLSGIQSILQIIGIAIILFNINIVLTLVALVACIPIIIISTGFGRHLEQASLNVNDELANSSANVEEVLHGLTTVQAFANEAKETSRYRKIMNNLFNAQMVQVKKESYYLSLMDFFAYAAVAAVLWIGGRLIVSGDLSMGDLAASLMYMLIFGFSIAEVGQLFANVSELTGVSHRIFEILDEKPSITNDGVLAIDDEKPLHITLSDVSFSYPSDKEKTIVQAISLDIKEGEEIAIVGPSGSGKTTLFKLLFRFYDHDDGKITINDKSIDEYSLDNLRNLFGLVSQDIFLFSGTVLENITYGNNDATIEEVEAAIHSIGADDFIHSLKDGLYEQVGVGGSKLSGGQKQLLGIARIYLKNPRVLLLDEATSSLDSESEEKVQNSLKKLKKDRTTIVIAHRLATVCESERIVLLEHGNIVAEGNHEYLNQNSALYNKYWQWQSRGVDPLTTSPELILNSN